MSSSSGSRYTPKSSEIERLIQQVRDCTEESVYNSQANSLLQEVLKDFNQRDTSKNWNYINALKDAINEGIEGTFDLAFGGSVRKHTYINGLSDVDLLVQINNTSLAQASPREVLRHFESQIKAALRNVDGVQISSGNLAVTVSYPDGTKLQLLPTIRTASGFRIASSRDPGQWSNVVRPASFARKLTEVNQANSGKVVPIIKLFKGLMHECGVDLSGYHAESLAIKVFENYQGGTSYKEMLIFMCRASTDFVKSPIADRTGQSLHVDDYLGSANSLQRHQVSKSLSRLVAQMEVADTRRSLAKWQEWFGDE
ncbi:nucleotidyltransferase [Limnothrix sp. FACHB-881]|uniref:CBASS oligonucleotide cyclase n=1 Tax=Limnothrix sp. FACHB-881 TaxID=2692819 RepID=UPI001686BE49|nr:CBASS oligonucleotide cyclase [Limnothrix sp. FACHB-881]MBD2636985.1 nucleotidyltransferase [Limnothrix sp. FACHB-881]